MPSLKSSQPQVTNHPSWAIAIFASRESANTLEEVVRAVAMACSTTEAIVDVLVNGNPSLANDLARRLDLDENWPQSNVHVNVWFIEVADKAQTWNTYVHQLYQGSKIAFFVDGYAKPEKNALRELFFVLSRDSRAQAASAVPSMGVSARRLAVAMQREGGIHGNLFALTDYAMHRIRRSGFRLPMGLYRTDSLIGALVSFDFDPERNTWDPTRIHVQPTATWRFRPLRWWHPEDIRVHFKRLRNQSQGALENLAVKDHFERRRQSPEALPSTARELVFRWWHGGNGPGWLQILKNPSWLLALRRLGAVRDYSRSNVAPKLLYQRPKGKPNCRCKC